MVRSDRYLSKPDPVQAINRSVASPGRELGFRVEGLKPSSPFSHGGRELGFRGFLRPHHLSPSSSSLFSRVIGHLLPLSPSHDFGVLEITMWAIRRAAIPVRWCFDLAHYFDHFPFVPYKNSMCFRVNLYSVVTPFLPWGLLGPVVVGWSAGASSAFRKSIMLRSLPHFLCNRSRSTELELLLSGLRISFLISVAVEAPNFSLC